MDYRSRFIRILFISALYAFLLSCSKVDIIVDDECGSQPDSIQMSEVIVNVRNFKSIEDNVYVSMSQNSIYTEEQIWVSTSKPTENEETIMFNVDYSSIEGFSTKAGIAYKALPSGFFKFDNNGVVTVPALSPDPVPLKITIYETNPLGAHLAPGRYLLPVSVQSIINKPSTKTLYFDILVREHFNGVADLYSGEDAFIVFYLNTSVYDPRLVTDYYFYKQDIMHFETNLWYNAVGNILNLKTVTLSHNVNSNMPKLTLSSDIRYVLDHYDEYLRPIKETNRKICLCIENEDPNLGFCNLSEPQIAELVRQIKMVLEVYRLDGINLWDKCVNYETINTKSYPSFIRALRESLGSDYLITLTDYGSPTEYFWDLEATGGIEVGTYIDYAWSGYNKREEGYQIVDPYHIGAAMVSTHQRKPILGLDKTKYGCVNFPWCAPPFTTDADVFGQGIENLVAWVSSGYKQSNIVVYEDIRSNIQDAIETSFEPAFCLGWLMPDCLQNGGTYLYVFDSQFIKDNNQGLYHSQYNKWIKNW